MVILHAHAAADGEPAVGPGLPMGRPAHRQTHRCGIREATPDQQPRQMGTITLLHQHKACDPNRIALVQARIRLRSQKPHPVRQASFRRRQDKHQGWILHRLPRSIGGQIAERWVRWNQHHQHSQHTAQPTGPGPLQRPGGAMEGLLQGPGQQQGPTDSHQGVKDAAQQQIEPAIQTADHKHHSPERQRQGADHSSSTLIH